MRREPRQAAPKAAFEPNLLLPRARRYFATVPFSGADPWPYDGPAMRTAQYERFDGIIRSISATATPDRRA